MCKSRLCLKSGEFVSLMVAWRIIAERSGRSPVCNLWTSRRASCVPFPREMVKGRRGDCGFLLLRGPGKRIGLALIFKTWGWRG